MNVVLKLKQKSSEYFSKLSRLDFQSAEFPVVSSNADSTIQVLSGGDFAKAILDLDTEDKIFDVVMKLSDLNVGLSFQTATHSIFLSVPKSTIILQGHSPL